MSRIEIHAPVVADVDGEIADAKLAWERLDRIETAAAMLGGERLSMGRRLISLRRLWPARGPKAKGWGEALAKIGISQPTAFRYMELAGYVENQQPSEIPFTENEIPDRDIKPEKVPTYAEAGIDKRPRASQKVEAETAVDESERRAAYDREVKASMPPSIDIRAQRAAVFFEEMRAARARILALKEKNVHLADVTTSPEEFMKAKHLLFEIVNQCLDELDAAGVLDGKEKRRQLTLLKGGLT